MKIIKRLNIILVIFMLANIAFKCSAADKNQIIIGTDYVPRDKSYDYVMNALENGFTNIDTSEDYYNQEEVGRAIIDFENRPENLASGKRAYVISKVLTPKNFSIDDYDDFEEYLKDSMDKSIVKLGHVDELLIYGKLPRFITISDVVRAFKSVREEEVYSGIKFGISTITVFEINQLIRDGLINYLQVVQNPYWYGATFLLNLFETGDEVYNKCKKYKIKYETYRTLGHGLLVKKCHLSPATLVQYSIDKGFVPIVKATGKKHLDELVEKVDTPIKIPEMEPICDSSEDIDFNIKILNKGQIDLISSKRYWYK